MCLSVSLYESAYTKAVASKMFQLHSNSLVHLFISIADATMHNTYTLPNF